MSVMVHNLVVHRLFLSENGQLNFVPRTACFDKSEQIEMLSQQLHSIYLSKPSKGVGGFIEGASSIFRKNIHSAFSDTNFFYQFSVDSGQYLLDTLKEEGMVETGFLVFNHYEYLATEYLLVCLIDSARKVSVNNDLNLDYAEQLELSKMQLALRIDLTQWKLTPANERYISFVKGRMGRKVSDFFMKFAGCEEKIDTKEQNKALMEQVDKYISTSTQEANEKEQHRDAVVNFYRSKLNNEEDISIAELSDVLPLHTNDKNFESFSKNAETQLEASIPPDKNALKRFSKFSGMGNGMSINFDRKLLGDKITYDPNKDCLTIIGVPPNLKDQLMRAAASNNEFDDQ